MSRQIGLFVDISNVYYCVGKKYGGRKVNYYSYYDYVKSLGNIQKAIAYGSQMDGEAEKFISRLRHIGFTPKYKKPKTYRGEEFVRKADWDVGITVDMIQMMDAFDTVVLGAADGDMTPAVRFLCERGKNIIVLACGISRELKDNATNCIEIPESMLEKIR